MYKRNIDISTPENMKFGSENHFYQDWMNQVLSQKSFDNAVLNISNFVTVLACGMKNWKSV